MTQLGYPVQNIHILVVFFFVHIHYRAFTSKYKITSNSNNVELDSHLLMTCHCRMVTAVTVATTMVAMVRRTRATLHVAVTSRVTYVEAPSRPACGRSRQVSGCHRIRVLFTIDHDYN